VAPPTMLGQLRKVLPSNTREKIVAEIDKDLTRFRVSEVVSRIQKVAML
ncbi:MAG: host attachment protein, partial [Proteobacteria bacterium]|nr:host attachment protein [Pseudomonadota bacterium]